MNDKRFSFFGFTSSVWASDIKWSEPVYIFISLCEFMWNERIESPIGTVRMVYQVQKWHQILLYLLIPLHIFVFIVVRAMLLLEQFYDEKS